MEEKEACAFACRLLFGADNVSDNASLFLLWTNTHFAIIIGQSGLTHSERRGRNYGK